MNIGDAARATGLPARTIRYYEDIGLVRADRSDSGYRAFSEPDIQKLAFVGRARSLGFSIADCRALLALYDDRNRASADVKRVAEEHLREIDRKLAELQSLRRVLGTLVEQCSGDGRPACPILEDLAGRRAAEPQTAHPQAARP
jgi:Cu(I)-responsive transcriptional regulator